MSITDIAEIRRQREAATRREPAVFIRMPKFGWCDDDDPTRFHRTGFVIQDLSAAVVQAAIDGLMAEIEAFGNGYGSFTHPVRRGAYYFSVGETIVFP